MKKVRLIDLGFCSYKESWDLQRKLRENKIAGDVTDYLITVEHPPVYTLGKGGNPGHLLLSEEDCAAKGISYYQTDRGGDITFHGPGQLVVYPVLDLNNFFRDVHKYLRYLEETVIKALSMFGISGERETGLTGVWVNGKKICAIGINVSRWITMHGLALNVNTDISYFKDIIPCGILHKDVTSMQEILGEAQCMKKVKRILINTFSVVFGIYLDDERKV